MAEKIDSTSEQGCEPMSPRDVSCIGARRTPAMATHLELRQLRYFVAVAEEGSFRKAARRLHVTQPPVSFQIKKLEEEIGVPLLLRDKRGARLTPPGEELLHRARLMLLHADRMLSDVRQAGKGHTGRLRLGMTDEFLYSGLSGLIASYQVERRGLIVENTVDLTYHLARAIVDSELDLAFVCPPLPAEVQRLNLLDLPPTRIRVAVPASHPLAGRGPVRLEALRDEHFVLTSETFLTGYFIQVMKLFEEAGFTPKVIHRVNLSDLRAQLVGENSGVALISEGSAAPRWPGVAFLEIRSRNARLPRAAVWGQDNPSTSLAQFLELLRQTDVLARSVESRAVVAR